jgi:hypothetical protein
MYKNKETNKEISMSKLIRKKGLRVFVVVTMSLLTLCPGAIAGICKELKTKETVGLENGLVKIAFDSTSGQLVSLKNLISNDEYLKNPGGNGNPFRLYLNPDKLPNMVTSVFPWRVPVPKEAEDFGGKILEAKQCGLLESSFVHIDGAGILKLISQNSDSGLEFELEVRLADNEDTAEIKLVIKNIDNKSLEIMTAFPYLTGLGLGDDHSTNLAVKMKKHGIPGEPAWSDPEPGKYSNGGVYGKHFIMPWQAIYEPKMNEGLGIIPIDPDLKNKLIYRFEGGGISIMYFPNDTIEPGKSSEYPPVRLMVHQGNWRKVARKYAHWFGNTFKLRLPPKWYTDMDMWSSAWCTSEDPEKLIKTGENLRYGTPEQKSRSFIEYIPRSFAGNTNDMIEYAMYHQGVISLKSYGQDGTYHFRHDMGGAPAFREGVKRVHKMGRRVMFYIASISSRKDSDLFKGTNMKDWLLMEQPGKMYDISYPEGVSMCFGYKPWQDHLAHVCKRLLWESGADGIRLDEFGTPNVLCYNPAHQHENPYNGTKWALEFLRVIREAMDEVNPEAILMTEGSCDFMHIYSDAGGLQMFYAGDDIEAIRMAVPTYRGPSHSQSAMETMLNGWVGSTKGVWRGSFPGYGQWLPKKPPGYPDSCDVQLRWHELRASFHEAQVDGTITDVDPFAPNVPQWVGRLWCADDYRLLVGGRNDLAPLSTATKIKLPELPDDIQCAYEFNAETLEIKQTELKRTGDDIFVTVKNRFTAVLLPSSSCPPLVFVDGKLPTGKAGEYFEISLKPFAPWGELDNPMVNIEMPGLELEQTDITLPGKVKVKAPDDIYPGLYYIRVTGNCLPLRRWINVIK